MNVPMEKFMRGLIFYALGPQETLGVLAFCSLLNIYFSLQVGQHPTV
jgi:hypothetical protein